MLFESTTPSSSVTTPSNDIDSLANRTRSKKIMSIPHNYAAANANGDAAFDSFQQDDGSTYLIDNNNLQQQDTSAIQPEYTSFNPSLLEPNSPYPNQLTQYNTSANSDVNAAVSEPSNAIVSASSSPVPGYLRLANKSLNNKKVTGKKVNKPSNKNRPAFVMKLWTMVNDNSNHELINWHHDGQTFIVTNRELFVQKILPKYFKHSNFASFVRQLNMYGWHKVQDASSGSLHSDERWQFINANFLKGRPDLLDKIVRNRPNDEDDGTGPNNVSQLDLSLFINELSALKSNQIKISQELQRVRNDNEMLWQELFKSREKNLLQNEKIEKILQFLASVYGNKVKVLEDSNFDDDSNSITTNDSGKNNLDVTNNSRHNKRLMIKQRNSSNSSSVNDTPVSHTTAFTPGFDKSPIQEIVRSPSLQINYTPSDLEDHTQNINDNAFQQFSDLDQANEDELFNPLANVNQPQQQQQQQQQQLQQQLQGQQQQQRPSLPRQPSSLEILTRSIDQNDQCIDDLMNRIQLQHAASNSPDPSQNFDLFDEFLSRDILPENSGTNNTSNINGTNSNNNNGSLLINANADGFTPDRKVGTIQEIHDDDGSNPKRKGSSGDDEEDGEVEEIINPSKKRRSDHFT